MSRLGALIQQLCPDGVELKKLKDCTEMKRGSSATKSTLIAGNIPVISGGREPAFYCSISNCDGETITIAGSGAGAGYVQYWNVPIFVNDAFSVRGLDDVNTKYLYYIMTNLQNDIYATKKGSGVPHVYISSIENFRIPVPPLEVQRKIVRILDQFTELTAELTTELTTELTARKKQYEYYRDKLLSEEIGASTEWKTIGEISSFRRGSFPQPYGNKEWYDGEGAMPFVQVADIGENMQLVEDTKRKISVTAQPKSVFAPKGSIVISLQGSIGRIAVTQYDAYIDRTVAIFKNISSVVLPKYFVYQLQRVFSIKEKTARGSTIKTITKEEFTGFQIPIPPLEEQRRIVSILDRFDALCNDLTSGLPAEIEARRKQYEYYRDKLLTFQEAKP